MLKASRINFISTRFLSSYMPLKPTWNLHQIETANTTDIPQEKIDFDKLERLSMLTIEEKTKKDLTDTIRVVQRMCTALEDNHVSKPFIHFEYLGAMELVDDETKHESIELQRSNIDVRRNMIIGNAPFSYDEYLVVPATKRGDEPV